MRTELGTTGAEWQVRVCVTENTSESGKIKVNGVSANYNPRYMAILSIFSWAL